MRMLTSAPHRMKIAHFGTGVLLEGYFQKKGEFVWASGDLLG
jgi:hypothetical protein